MRILKISILIAAAAAAAAGQSLSSIPASFVDIGFGARPAALGGAFVAVSNDVNAMMWNPAGLASMQKNQATFVHTNQLGLVPYQYYGVVHPLASGKRSLGLAVVSSGDQALRELTVQATYAQSVTSKLNAGITMKYRHASFGNNSLDGVDYFVFDPEEVSEGMQHQVQGNASGFGVDVGMTYVFLSKVSFGIVVKDLFAPLTWNSKTGSTTVSSKGSYTESLPAELAIGSAMQVLDDFLVVVDYNPALSKTVSNKVRAGGEITLLKIIALRAGILHYLSNETQAAYSFGVGCKTPFVGGLSAVFDYTYLHQSLAATQRFSIGVEF
jgi:hypothetical protein